MVRPLTGWHPSSASLPALPLPAPPAFPHQLHPRVCVPRTLSYGSSWGGLRPTRTDGGDGLQQGHGTSLNPPAFLGFDSTEEVSTIFPDAPSGVILGAGGVRFRMVRQGSPPSPSRQLCLISASCPACLHPILLEEKVLPLEKPPTEVIR